MILIVIVSANCELLLPEYLAIAEVITKIVIISHLTVVL